MRLSHYVASLDRMRRPLIRHALLNGSVRAILFIIRLLAFPILWFLCPVCLAAVRSALQKLRTKLYGVVWSSAIYAGWFARRVMKHRTPPSVQATQYHRPGAAQVRLRNGVVILPRPRDPRRYKRPVTSTRPQSPVKKRKSNR